MGQDIFDLIIVLALVLFAGRGFVHGFVGEVAGVVSLVGGFWAAHAYHSLLSPRLTAIADPAWRTIAAYVLIFLAVILVVAVLARLLQKILSFSFVSWADRLAAACWAWPRGCCSARWRCWCCKNSFTTRRSCSIRASCPISTP